MKTEIDFETGSHITRRMCVGFIVSTEYVQRVLPMWRSELLDTNLPRIVSNWCLDYYRKYERAPGTEIESVYADRKHELDDDTAEQMELLLDSIADDNERDVFNVEYLIDQTRDYLRARHIETHIEDVKERVQRGELSEAEAQLAQYAPTTKDKSTYIDPFSSDAGAALRAAFTTRATPLVRYPYALGDFWNDELTRDSFVAVMAREKGCKSWVLMDAALRAARQGCNVALFQAGDMTENQMLRRIAIHAARRSDLERYCKDIWLPAVDCVLHQENRCDRDIREDVLYDDPVLEGEMTFEHLQESSRDYPEHKPCHNCNAIRGTVWLKKQPDVSPLTEFDVEREMEKFKKHIKGRLRISTHANGSLSVTDIKALLNQWEREDQFVVDVVVIDYADILAPCPDHARLVDRHQQNRIWARLRNLSQERHCLLMTATQAKATAYSKELLDLSDYSEDKRKYAHVTAMFGLNQTADEKRIGLLRINTLLTRDSDYATDRPVHVLQRLQIGRPILGSYR